MEKRQAVEMGGAEEDGEDDARVRARGRGDLDGGEGYR